MTVGRAAPGASARCSSTSGQATAETAWITFVLLGGAAAAGWPYLRLLLAGLERYLEAIYFMLDGPFP